MENGNLRKRKLSESDSENDREDGRRRIESESKRDKRLKDPPCESGFHTTPPITD